MKRVVLIAAMLVMATPAAAADEDKTPPVPSEFQAGWAVKGNCNKTVARFEVGAFRAGWGEEYQGPIHFDAARRALVWNDPTKTEVFRIGPAGKQMFRSQTPDAAPEVLIKCPGKLMKMRKR